MPSTLTVVSMPGHQQQERRGDQLVLDSRSPESRSSTRADSRSSPGSSRRRRISERMHWKRLRYETALRSANSAALDDVLGPGLKSVRSSLGHAEQFAH
ncbi:hypothetical protein [Streptomyces sp. KL116D]|uniref:hypothetical protein n=1 Tax=Streptomyces sp. KL116D TaxID=3045152 RepID=UPI0035587AC9